MSLKIIPLVLGPMANNSYLVGDTSSGEAVAIDPSFQSEELLKQAENEKIKIKAIWLTHAHFDHIAGVATICEAVSASIPVGLHKEDLPLWESGGGGTQFGLMLDKTISPTFFFVHHETLSIGEFDFQIRHTPGHSRGHVIFYSRDLNAAFCGDLIFYRSIGRTDLPGGDYAQLIESIRTQIFTLPASTKLFCGHGETTSIEHEQKFNPFLT